MINYLRNTSGLLFAAIYSMYKNNGGFMVQTTHGYAQNARISENGYSRA
jgi:hypothetical protein